MEGGEVCERTGISGVGSDCSLPQRPGTALPDSSPGVKKASVEKFSLIGSVILMGF